MASDSQTTCKKVELPVCFATLILNHNLELCTATIRSSFCKYKRNLFSSDGILKFFQNDGHGNRFGLSPVTFGRSEENLIIFFFGICTGMNCYIRH